MNTDAVSAMLVAVSAICLLTGVRGLVEGRRNGIENGPNTLMHYPAPIPWLRRRVTAARWVVWIGHLYVSAGIAGFLGAWMLWTTPPYTVHESRCEPIAEQLMAAYPAPLQGGQVETSTHVEGCRASILDTKKVRWFDVHSTHRAQGFVQHFNQERQHLERAAYKLSPIDGLGSRAILAQSRNGAGLNPILLYTDEYGQHKIEINARMIDLENLSVIIDALSTSATQKTK